MAGGDGTRIVAVTAAQCAGDDKATSAARPDNEAVAQRQPRIGQGEPPELVVAVRIDPRLIEHEIGGEVGQHLRQVAREGLHVAIVVEPVGEAL